MRYCRIVVAASVAAVLLTAALVVLIALPRQGRQAAGPAQTSCAARLIHDWSDGRIDGFYAVGCYRAALHSLPADLRVYSSAPEDIRQALSARIVRGRQKISAHQGATSVRHMASARSSAP